MDININTLMVILVLLFPFCVGTISIYKSYKIRKTGISLVFDRYTNHVKINKGKAAHNDAVADLVFGLFFLIFSIALPLMLYFSNK